MKFFKFFVAAAGLLLVTSCGGNGGGGSEPAKDKFTVTFDYNYEGSPEALVVTVDKGAKVAQPDDPEEREGYKFMGWFKSKTSTDEAFAFDFNTEIYQDYKVYAGWGEFVEQTWCVVGSFQGWDIGTAPEMTTEDYENYTYTFNCPAGTNFKLAKDHDWEVQAKYEQLDLENSDVEELGISENEHDKGNCNIHVENAAQVKVDYNPFDNVIVVTKAGDLSLTITGYSFKWNSSALSWTAESLSPADAQLTGKWTTAETQLAAGDEFGFLKTTYYDDGSSEKDSWFAADNVKFNDERINDEGGNYKVVSTGKYVLSVSVDAEGAISVAVDSYKEVVLTPDHYNFYLAGSVAGWDVNDVYVFAAQGEAKLEGTWTLVADLEENEEVQPIYTISYVEGGTSSTSWMGTGAENLPDGIEAGGNYKCTTAGSYLFQIVVVGTTMTVTISPAEL
jgi:uncharacterized repeat protein (TIGR02543 family)